MLTLAAFLTAICLLVAVHEWGHYAMARLCGVTVLRFSIGIGPVLWRRQSTPLATEFALGLFPIGGYVRMLDEREGVVPVTERDQAFNTQALHKRAAIVAAGPAANLLFAVLLYTLVNWLGVWQPQAILSQPASASIAAKAGLQAGDQILSAASAGEVLEPVRSFDALRWLLTRSALDHRNLDVQAQHAGSSASQVLTLSLDNLDTRLPDAAMFQAIGIAAPFSSAVIGDVMPDGAAAAAGLRPNDRVLQVDATTIVEAAQLRELVRQSGRTGTAAMQTWLVERAGGHLHIAVQPRVVQDSGASLGRVGAMIGGMPAMTLVRYGPLQGVQAAVQRTWEVSTLTVQMMARMVTGNTSIKALSGPVTIADYAGRSAAMGGVEFLVFLALVSVSLGVLNLLPLPILDGGHLMYYAWEALTGRPVSQTWANVLQRVGMVLLFLMMSIALFNDFTRLLG